MSPTASALDPAEELEVPLAELADEPAAGGVLEQEPVALLDELDDACATSSRPTDAELVAPILELSEDDPLPPHAVNIPPMISEPAMNSVRERTPVLFIGTP